MQLPPNEQPSFRIKGGSENLIQTLASKIEEDTISLGEQILSLADGKDKVIIETTHRKILAKTVISTLPPFLFSKTINVNPKLPQSLLDAMQMTHTWMGESIKIALTYPEPFWRTEDLSGTIFSNVGPIPEMYDHSNHKDSSFALMGFLNSVYFSISKEERLGLVLNQLRKYFGEKADTFLEYHEVVWRTDPLTFQAYPSHVLPHQNNGHQIYHKPIWDGKLYIGGTETADQYPGYMEGAIRSAHWIFNQILKE